MTTTTTEMAFTREDMLDPIERMFEREYSNKYNVFEELLTTTEGGSGLADLAYVQGSEKGLHVVRIEESYRDCLTNVNAGVHSLSKIESNYRWLAVPLHEFRDGEDAFNELLHKTCKRRGFGLIAVQQKGLGVSAKVLLEPSKTEGNFLPLYGDLRQKWLEARRGRTSRGEYRVIDYTL